MAKVIECRNNEGPELRGYGIWCPACRTIHHFPKDRWTFNGDMEKPTFSPSMLIRGYLGPDNYGTCHSFVRDGKIIYCGDCTHSLKGQTVDLPDVHEAIKKGGV